MLKNAKYAIENFYVGELYLSYKFGNLLAQSKLSRFEQHERNKVSTISMYGAIAFQSGLINKYTDWDKRRSYEGVLTIFYKCNGECISLHNGLSYNAVGNDFYKNLVQLSELLPVVDYTIPKCISTREAIDLFDTMFKKSRFHKLDNLYSQNEHSLDDFYVGNLNLYEGYLPDNDNKRMYEYSNLPQKYILFRSDASLGGMYGRNGKSKDDYGLVYDAHDSADFKCLFLRQPSCLYNVHNYQTYSNGILKKEHATGFDTGESYYDWIVPFRDILEEREINYNSSTLTIPKALTLYRKVK